ncbi:TlpA family protein disulfide reductase [Planctomicrobium sp. SH668]|uniref:TlpA family protein disulfide reductase n=1 Tax=Planctomicrobium sp. SH668 TaxID=3448126 RepID=UPI003F5BBD44
MSDFNFRQSQPLYRDFWTGMLLSLGASCLVVQLSGCGEVPAPIGQQQPEYSHHPTREEELPTQQNRAAFRQTAEIELISNEETVVDGPTKDSPEWVVMEISRLRNLPLDRVRQRIPGRVEKYEEIELTPEQVAIERVRRNQKIVELATQVIGKTNQSPESTELFNAAVIFLSDARVELAVDGDESQIQLLDENAEALYSRDPRSFAAVEAASHLVELTQIQAVKFAKTDAKWAKAFSRQARLFAERFPQETNRAAVNLIAAGRACEQLKLDFEAESCLAMIEQIAPDSPYQEQVAGALRRLRLTGKPLADFGGSTLDGEFTSANQYRGKTLLVAFWASNSAEFQRDLPKIQTAIQTSNGKLAVVGVNLDREDRLAEEFVANRGIAWKSIFFSDPEKRGSRNPVARHYGVINVPEYWLVDANGVVRSIHVNVAQLDQELEILLTK